MSQRTKAELAKIKPLSRFVEHFDLMPPTELLDTSSVEAPTEEGSLEKRPASPLHALSNGHPSSLSIKSAEPLQTSATKYSPTSPNANIRDYSRNAPLSPSMASLSAGQLPPDLLKLVGRSQSNPANNTSTPIANDNSKKTSDVSATMTKVASLLSEESAPIVAPLNNANKKPSTYVTNQEYSPSTASRSRLSRNSLNKADIIIRRYDAWSKFLTLIISWVGEIARLSSQSERSFSSLLKEHRFSNLKGSTIDSANGIHAIIHGFTADLALQEQQFGHRLKEHVPTLEKFKKECTVHIKSLKSRPDLALDEFLRRAEVTASIMAQLSRTCKEARRTIEKGAQLTSDPWLANLYVLRQLKREVDEENRLRRLMVPIQQTMLDFETRLLRTVQETIKACFERPSNSLTEERLESLQASLNAAVSDNWDTFASNNKKDIVNEKNPKKHYLKINYPFKNDPLVMTLHKGELERKSGVLNKYTQRFFVLTESGFLHQFKLNDKVSPEFSIYIPNATIIPSVDISHLNLATLQLESDKSNSYSFEIQRSGSVLQRDKSYVFRTFSLAEMVVWCKLLSDVATRPSDATFQPKPQYRPSTAMSSHSSERSSMLITEIARQTSPQHQETTPPPSPIQQLPESLQSKINRITSVASDIPQYAIQQPIISPTTSTELYMPSLIEDHVEGRHKQYVPQLNI